MFGSHGFGPLLEIKKRKKMHGEEYRADLRESEPCQILYLAGRRQVVTFLEDSRYAVVTSESHSIGISYRWQPSI
jgi:hypothetical protein